MMGDAGIEMMPLMWYGIILPLYAQLSRLEPVHIIVSIIIANKIKPAKIMSSLS